MAEITVVVTLISAFLMLAYYGLAGVYMILKIVHEIIKLCETLKNR